MHRVSFVHQKAFRFDLIGEFGEFRTQMIASQAAVVKLQVPVRMSAVGIGSVGGEDDCKGDCPRFNRNWDEILQRGCCKRCRLPTHKDRITSEKLKITDVEEENDCSRNLMVFGLVEKK